MSLFAPLTLRDVTLKSRVVVSPMCQYSSEDGFANDWHLVHLGSRAVGGAALILTEAAAVEARGRISPQDLGIWKDAHVEGLSRINRFIKAQGSIPGIQLAHAGRKASTRRPWEGKGAVPPSEGGWTPVAVSTEPFDADYPKPTALDAEGIRQVVRAFEQAAVRAKDAGFEVVEVHAAHGYLIHEFLSPASNRRTDAYGGSFENRIRLLREVVAGVRKHWPERLPVLVRISATDWIPEGWTPEMSVELGRVLAREGVDVIDCSSGGIRPQVKIESGPGYQTPFAAKLRAEAGIKTGAVGMISAPAQADHIIRTGQADLVLLARAMLRDAYWALDAAHQLGIDLPWPSQYERARG